MFNLNEKTTFNLFIYQNNLLTKTISIPKDVYSDFKLPEGVDFLEIKEYNGSYKLTTILTIHLGFDCIFKDLLFTNDELEKSSKKIVLNDNLDLNKVDLRVLCKINDNTIYVEKVLNNNELVFNTLEEIESYIYKLSKQIGKFNRESEKVKKLIEFTH